MYTSMTESLLGRREEEAIKGPCVTTHPEASVRCRYRSYVLTYFL